MESIQLTSNPRRATIKAAVANILTETGFHSAERQCVETLSEMLQGREYSYFFINLDLDRQEHTIFNS